MPLGAWLQLSSSMILHGLAGVEFAPPEKKRDKHRADPLLAAYGEQLLAGSSLANLPPDDGPQESATHWVTVSSTPRSWT